MRITYGEKLFRIICGCLLLSFGIWGASYARNATRAMMLYKRARYGVFEGTRFHRKPMEDAESIIRACDSAQRLYAKNHYFTMFASERCLATALVCQDAPEMFEHFFSYAKYWDRISQGQFPRQFESMYIHARLLIEEGKADEALDYWYANAVEPCFWNPQNRRIFVEMLINAGYYSRAEREAKWLRGGNQVLRENNIMPGHH